MLWIFHRTNLVTWNFSRKLELETTLAQSQNDTKKTPWRNLQETKEDIYIEHKCRIGKMRWKKERHKKDCKKDLELDGS